jgi:hypothetical protein
MPVTSKSQFQVISFNKQKLYRKYIILKVIDAVIISYLDLCFEMETITISGRPQRLQPLTEKPP